MQITGSPGGGSSNQAWSPGGPTAPNDPQLDPTLADYSAQEGFLQWLSGPDFYGQDPFTIGYSEQNAIAQSHGFHPAGTPNILQTNNVGFLQDIVSAFGADITPDELTQIANDQQAQAAFNAGKTAGLTRWLKANSPAYHAATSRASAPKYATVAEELANMEPIARASYAREQATIARENATLAEETFYRDHQQAFSLVQQYFGLGRYQADHNMLARITAAGDGAAQEAFIRALPSGHIPGMNIGTYSDAKTLLDTAMQPIYGHPGNDNMIKELVDGGNNTKTGVGYYLDQQPLQPGKNIDPIVYNSAYQGARPTTMAVWNQEPSPTDIHTVWAANGSPGAIAPTDAKQAAANAGAGTTPAPTPAPNPKPQLSVVGA